jgi:hypothetical protein
MAGQQDYSPSFRQGFARCAAESEHPELWRGLAGAWAPSLGVTGKTIFDWSGNGRTAVNSSPYLTWKATDRGTALSSSGDNDSIPLAIPAWTTGTTFSIVLLAKLTTISSAYQTIASNDDGLGFFIQNADLCWSDADAETVSSPANLVAVGKWNLFGLSAVDGAGTFWLNGNPRGTAAVHSLSLNSIIRDVNGSPIVGFVAFAGFWNRPLTATEWRQVHVEPLSLFVPSRPMYGSSVRRPRVAYRRVLASAYGVSQ